MAQKKTAIAAANECQYLCVNNKWRLEIDNATEGFYCPAPQSGGCTNGATKWTPAVPIPPMELAANNAEYVYRKSTKSLHFKAGSCGRGKHFPLAITVKELTKFDPDAAELVKSMQKNKRIASFSVVLKAQKIEQV